MKELTRNIKKVIEKMLLKHYMKKLYKLNLLHTINTGATNS